MPLQKNIFGQDEPPRQMGYDNATPNGYAAMPGTGPADETCGSCRHHAVLTFSKRYHKCRLRRAHWSRSVVTDIRVRSPACSKWEAKQ